MKTFHSSVVVFVAVIVLFSGQAFAECVDGNGNRYDLPRCYHSEISSAQAYLMTSHDRGNVANDPFANAVIIDVRGIDEYVAGHPRGAINIPYPRIIRFSDGSSLSQYPDVFVAAVVAAFPDAQTPILTLCRTGYRSVLAANLLAEAGYVNVRNIWEGFVGNHKTDTAGNVLDLNNDGLINDADRDGWMNYQGLPWTTRLHPKLLYLPYIEYYYQ